MVVAGSNVPDFKLLEATLEMVVVERLKQKELYDLTTDPLRDGQHIRERRPLSPRGSAGEAGDPLELLRGRVPGGRGHSVAPYALLAAAILSLADVFEDPGVGGKESTSSK